MTIAKIRAFILRHNLLKFLFFGNYFYALCAVIMSAESLIVLGFATADLHYLLILFMGVIVFYTHAYRALDKTDEASVFQNPFYLQRTLWYIRNHRLVRVQQFLLAAIIFAAVIYYYWPIFCSGVIAIPEYLFMVLIALLALAYVGYGSWNIRRFGLLKPMVIALLWMALVTLLPVMTSHWKERLPDHAYSTIIKLCLYNTIYILQLCILFDIKDYAVDARSQLRTYVVWLGLKRTMRYVIVPLYILSVVLWYLLASDLHYTPIQILIGYIPIAALAWVIYALRTPQPLLFYLFIVDGLMLLKGITGIILVSIHG